MITIIIIMTFSYLLVIIAKGGCLEQGDKLKCELLVCQMRFCQATNAKKYIHVQQKKTLYMEKIPCINTHPRKNIS